MFRTKVDGLKTGTVLFQCTLFVRRLLAEPEKTLFIEWVQVGGEWVRGGGSLTLCPEHWAGKDHWAHWAGIVNIIEFIDWVHWSQTWGLPLLHSFITNSELLMKLFLFLVHGLFYKGLKVKYHSACLNSDWTWTNWVVENLK